MARDTTGASLARLSRRVRDSVYTGRDPVR